MMCFIIRYPVTPGKKDSKNVFTEYFPCISPKMDLKPTIPLIQPKTFNLILQHDRVLICFQEIVNFFGI